jgi:uncharacterized protein (DUF1501 family)
MRMAGTHEQPRQSQPLRSRRSFLQASLAGGVGLALGDALTAAAPGDSLPNAPAKALIQICLMGGLSHLDSFDSKPAAGSAYQSGLRTVPTRLSGVAFASQLSQTAQLADRMTICRAVTHDQESHGHARHYLFTGQPPTSSFTFASLGTVVAWQLGPRNGLPPYICVPGLPSVHAGSGPLGVAYAPFSLGREPGERSYCSRDVILPLPEDESGGISSWATRQAVDLEAEPVSVRDEYGRNGPGQKLLMARRLVAAGARVVTVACGGWDMHADLVRSMDRQLPPFDQAFAALIRDLERTGLFASTLVVVASEFGRSPRINAQGGRDHWPRVASAVLAGAGVRQGCVYGSSDATGSEPRDQPLSPADLAATLCHLLGVAPGGRRGKVCTDLLS